MPLRHCYARQMPPAIFLPDKLSLRLFKAFGFAILSFLVAVSARAAEFRLATFEADVTIPIDHPCMGGGIAPARAVADPLAARGFVLIGGEKPFVLVSLDWCEIRGTSHDKWKRALAEAAGTPTSAGAVFTARMSTMRRSWMRTRKNSCATWRRRARGRRSRRPIRRLPCRLLPSAGRLSTTQSRASPALARRLCAASPPGARHVTHFGLGKAKVERVASNRRFLRGERRP